MLAGSQPTLLSALRQRPFYLFTCFPFLQTLRYLQKHRMASLYAIYFFNAAPLLEFTWLLRASTRLQKNEISLRSTET